MKKRTVVVVAITLILALLAVAVIATFPSYLFEETPNDSTSAPIQSGNIVEGEIEPGVDVGVMGDENGVEAVLPTVDDTELGYSETPESELTVIAEAKNVKVLAEAGAFEDGTKVKINKLGVLNRAYYRARHYLENIAKEFTVFELSAKNGGKDVAPNGLVKLSFTLTEGYHIDNVAVYYLLNDGGVQEVASKVSEDGKTVSAKISQTGVYILVEKELKTENGTPSDNTSTESDKTDSNVSSSTPEDTSSNTSSDVSSDSSNDSSDSSSSDTSSEDENKETMDGWTPWY